MSLFKFLIIYNKKGVISCFQHLGIVSSTYDSRLRLREVWLEACQEYPVHDTVSWHLASAKRNAVCSVRCKCKKSGLACTQLCVCNGGCSRN